MGKLGSLWCIAVGMLWNTFPTHSFSNYDTTYFPLNHALDRGNTILIRWQSPLYYQWEVSELSCAVTFQCKTFQFFQWPSLHSSSLGSTANKLLSKSCRSRIECLPSSRLRERETYTLNPDNGPEGRLAIFRMTLPSSDLELGVQALAYIAFTY